VEMKNQRSMFSSKRFLVGGLLVIGLYVVCAIRLLVIVTKHVPEPPAVSTSTIGEAGQCLDKNGKWLPCTDQWSLDAEQRVTGQLFPHNCPALITVKDKTGRLVQLYADDTLASPSPNPFSPDANGKYHFIVAEGGKYDVTFSQDCRTKGDVDPGTPGEWHRLKLNNNKPFYKKPIVPLYQRGMYLDANGTCHITPRWHQGEPIPKGGSPDNIACGSGEPKFEACEWPKQWVKADDGIVGQRYICSNGDCGKLIIQ
jgi:hypothetical protein